MLSKEVLGSAEQVFFIIVGEVSSSGGQIIEDANRLHGGNQTRRDPEDPRSTIQLRHPLLPLFFKSKKRKGLQLPPVGDVQQDKNKHLHKSGTGGTCQSHQKILLKY